MKVRRTTSVGATGAGLLLLALLVSAPVAASDKRPASKAAKNRALFLARCSTCHSPSRVFHRKASPGAWREIVDRMRRMPQSGISPADAVRIRDYLVSLGSDGRRDKTATVGGRKSYGADWLSVLEVATAKDGVVRLAGRPYRVESDGLSATLRRGGKKWGVALSPAGRVVATARLDSWRVGRTRYERHLVLYDVRGEAQRFGVALRKLPAARR